MSKTEDRIMAQIASKGCFIATRASGRGAHDGTVRVGRRDSEILLRLRDDGRVKLEVVRERETKRGRTVEYTTYVATAV